MSLVSTNTNVQNIFLDCANGFRPLNNKCYLWLGENTFENHIKYCDLRLGTLLSASFEDPDPAILVAKKFMEEKSKTKIYLGKSFVLNYFRGKYYATKT